MNKWASFMEECVQSDLTLRSFVRNPSEYFITHTEFRRCVEGTIIWDFVIEIHSIGVKKPVYTKSFPFYYDEAGNMVAHSYKHKIIRASSAVTLV